MPNSEFFIFLVKFLYVNRFITSQSKNKIQLKTQQLICVMRFYNTNDNYTVCEIFYKMCFISKKKINNNQHFLCIVDS